MRARGSGCGGRCGMSKPFEFASSHTPRMAKAVTLPLAAAPAPPDVARPDPLMFREGAMTPEQMRASACLPCFMGCIAGSVCVIFMILAATDVYLWTAAIFPAVLAVILCGSAAVRARIVDWYVERHNARCAEWDAQHPETMV